MWELLDPILIDYDLPCSVYWTGTYYTSWYSGKTGAPSLPTHILWEIEDGFTEGLLGRAAEIAEGNEFGPIPERKVTVNISFAPGAVQEYTGVFTSSSNAETQAEVALTGLWQITTLYVKHDAAGTGSGIDWTNAFTDLTDGIAAAVEQSIHYVNIARGTYFPKTLMEPGKGNRFKAFRLYNALKLQGSFTGDDLTPEAQDFTDPTILSGDVPLYQSYHVLYLADNLGLTSTASLYDVVITGGKADRYKGVAHSKYGGGIYCGTGNTPIFNNVITQNCSAVEGGGVYVKRANPVFEDCSSDNNIAVKNGGGFYFENCSYVSAAFSNTAADYNTAGGNGGGIYNKDSVIPFQDLMLRFNSAAGSGGGLYQTGFNSENLIGPYLFSNPEIRGNKAKKTGGGIAVNGGSAILNSISLSQNKALSGGGVFADDTDIQIVECDITSNEADKGGGVYSSNSDLLIDQTFFTDNKAWKKGGGVYTDKNRSINISANSVFDGNTAEYGAGWFTDRSDINIAGITAVKNIASVSGGFIYGTACELVLSGCAFQNNYPLDKQAAGDRTSLIVRSSGMFTPGQLFEEVIDARIESDDLGFTDYDNGNYLPAFPASPLIGESSLDYFPVNLRRDIRGVVRGSSGFVTIGAYDLEDTYPYYYYY